MSIDIGVGGHWWHWALVDNEGDERAGLGDEAGRQGSRVWGSLPPIDAGSGKIVHGFRTFFSGRVGRASAKAGCDAGENTGARRPCQGVEGPFLHFPHFSHNLHFGLLPAEPAFHPLDRPGFATTFLLAAPQFRTHNFQRFAAPVDTKCSKITHGEIEIRDGKMCVMVLSAPSADSA